MKLPELSDCPANYTPGISERRSGASKFSMQDRLGSTERLTDSNQATTDTRTFDAFGLLVSSSGSTPTPFTFAGAWGYQADSDSGFMLLGHRYYDPSTGRFLTRDPAQDGRNWYTYVESAPTMAIDADGNQLLRVIWIGAKWIGRQLIRGAGKSARRLGGGIARKLRDDLPRVRQLIDHVKGKNWSPPKGIKGGSRYKDYPGDLPGGGDYIKYDLYPPSTTGRGPERLVIDRISGRTWYSPDHYKTFIEIK